ncbi:exocyst complex component 6B [Tachysurus ichikawai]
MRGSDNPVPVSSTTTIPPPQPSSLFVQRARKVGPITPPQGHAELLDLFTQWDWSTYLADYGRPTCKYLRVSPHTALALLEKMKDTSRKNNMFAQFRKNERDKQKLIDTVVKQLRNLISSHQS